MKEKHNLQINISSVYDNSMIFKTFQTDLDGIVLNS